jgi:site-specific DNA recombinase
VSAATLTRPTAGSSLGVGVAVAYCRISRDGDGRGLGVERQSEDNLRLASILGLAIAPADLLIENDMSASGYSAKERIVWPKLVERVRAGEVSQIVAYSLSRLTRNMVEREELLALRHLGLTVTTAQGQRIYPGMTASEVQMIRMIGVNDTAESDQISERTRRAFDQNAAKGTPHGPIAYGWDRHHERNGEVVDIVNEAQAAVIREAASRVIAGDSIRSIVAELNDRGEPAPRGGAWSATILTKLLLRERNAARRVHRGEVVGPAAWAAILDDDTFDTLVAVMRDPARFTGRSGTRNLLSGLIICSKCGEARVWVRPGSGGTASAYACKGCHGLRRRQEGVDLYVVEAVCARLARPDALDWLAQDQGALVAARAHLAGLEAQAKALADAYLDGKASIEQMTYANGALLPKISAARAAVELARPIPAAVRALAGLGDVESVREAWELLTHDQRRSVIRELVTITLLPTQRRKFDPEGLRLDWRTSSPELA